MFKHWRTMPLGGMVALTIPPRASMDYLIVQPLIWLMNWVMDWFIHGANDFKIVQRKNPIEKKEAYIMMNGKYLLTCKASATDHYLGHITTIKNELSQKTIAATAEAAKERLKELMAWSSRMKTQHEFITIACLLGMIITLACLYITEWHEFITLACFVVICASQNGMIITIACLFGRLLVMHSSHIFCVLATDLLHLTLDA